ncbi:hypothetical protein G5714_020763 [Onychostoma macrolepis]|uniref:Uncharacterized protein n=1 Tax=Onychostoma macrolepis TaxID=369639 RepID=A0A7J6BW44_9TELE|nr:hypothetical protein G5714_020763 [Onychostoma macrolepis]
MSTAVKLNQVNEDDIVGRLKWKGPGSVTIPLENICRVSCQAEFSQPVSKGIVLVEGEDETPLPQGLMVQPMVALASAVNGENFSVLLQNETKREVSLPEEEKKDEENTNEGTHANKKSHSVSSEGRRVLEEWKNQFAVNFLLAL